MLHNALGLSAGAAGDDTGVIQPIWAEYALEAMSANGMPLTGDALLTRGEAAQILYKASKMVTDQTRFLSLEQ